MKIWILAALAQHLVLSDVIPTKWKFAHYLKNFELDDLVLNEVVSHIVELFYSRTI